ncbi:hypothetical protein STEG23_005835 [Scotinomys teguina]
MPGSSRQWGRKVGSALLSLQQEDQENVNPEKPTDGSLESPYAMDMSIVLEDEKPWAGYMEKQPDITNSVRAILVGWLIEVGEEYKLQNETLYLAVNSIDRFLSSMSVLRGKLQLVGTVAMLLASKSEEIYPQK